MWHCINKPIVCVKCLILNSETETELRAVKGHVGYWAVISTTTAQNENKNKNVDIYKIYKELTHFYHICILVSKDQETGSIQTIV